MSVIEDEITRRVAEGLQRVGIEYMIVGSYASNVHGRPRDSFDADILADIRPCHVEALCREFDADFVVVPEAIAASVEGCKMFNLIPRSGIFKVDIIPLPDDAFDREEFKRRKAIDVFGARLYFSTPEDLVLAKLRWYRKGGDVSGRQIEDARDVAAAQGSSLDRDYLRRWAAVLCIDDLLERVLRDLPPDSVEARPWM